TTTNAVPPASPAFGSPASAGKLLQRKAVPVVAVARKHSPLNGLLIALKFETTVSFGWVQSWPPSVESSSPIQSPLLRSYQAALRSPFASKPMLDPFRQLLERTLIECAAPNQVAPPSSV